jgi:hypothetical protein
MASGPEMMMTAMLKALGFNPAKFVNDINAFIQGVNVQIASFTQSANSINQRLEKLQKENEEIRGTLDLILSTLQGKVIDHVGQHNEFNYVNGRNGATGFQSHIGGNGDGPAEPTNPDGTGGGYEPAGGSGQ